jgi:hypothetical protein
MTMVPQSLELEDIEYGDEEYGYAIQGPPVPRVSPKRKRRKNGGTPTPSEHAGTPMGGFEGYEYPGATPKAAAANAPGWDATSLSEFSTTAAPGGKGLRNFAPMEAKVITEEMIQGEMEDRGKALAMYHAKRKEIEERVDDKDDSAVLERMQGYDPDAAFQVPILDYALNQESLMVNDKNVSSYTYESRTADKRLMKRRDKWTKINEDEKYEPVSLIAQVCACRVMCEFCCVHVWDHGTVRGCRESFIFEIDLIRPSFRRWQLRRKPRRQPRRSSSVTSRTSPPPRPPCSRARPSGGRKRKTGRSTSTSRFQ